MLYHTTYYGTPFCQDPSFGGSSLTPDCLQLERTSPRDLVQMQQMWVWLKVSHFQVPSNNCCSSKDHTLHSICLTSQSGILQPWGWHLPGIILLISAKVMPKVEGTFQWPMHKCFSPTPHGIYAVSQAIRLLHFTTN